MAPLASEIGVIANPFAGPKRDTRLRIDVVDFCKLHKIPLLMTQDVGLISKALLKLINEVGVKVLCVFGGDGTLHKVIDILIYENERDHLHHFPIVSSLGGGTMVAVHQGWLGWREKPVEVLRRVYRATRQHLPLRKCRPLKVSFTTADDKPSVRYGFMFIHGAIAEIIKVYDDQGRSPANGARNIALGMLAGITGYPRKYSQLIQQADAELKADGEVLSVTRPLSVVASITESLIFQMRPYAGHAESNQFYALSYELNPLEVSLLVPFAARGLLIPHGRRFFNRPVCSMEIRSSANRINLDGEDFLTNPEHAVFLELGPEIELVSSFPRRS